MEHITRNSKQKLIHEQGLSLIEVIVSMGIIGAMFILYVSAMNTVVLTKRIRQENLAYHIANKKMEELRGTYFLLLPPSGAILDPLLSKIPSGSGSFTVSDHAGFVGLKELTVQVNWIGDNGAAKQIQLKSLAGSGGINP